MQSTDILRNCAAPGNRKGQKQSVEAWLVKTLADVATGSEEDTPFGFRQLSERGHSRLYLGFRHSASQGDQVANLADESVRLAGLSGLAKTLTISLQIFYFSRTNFGRNLR